MKSSVPEKSATLNARKSAAHNHNGCSPHGADSHIARLHPPEARTANASSPLTHDQDSGRRIGNTVFGEELHNAERFRMLHIEWNW